MKKNFFKKLALVMALTLAVTSVPATSASAAKAPGFKSTKVTVKVDQTKKYSTANSSKYSVKFKIGNKKVATIHSSKGSKSVKVTGVAAGKTTLRADFKSYKTKKVTVKRIPVTVKEVKLAVTAKQTGAKTIEVTANKALAADTKVTVKKGNVQTALAEKTGVAISADGTKVTLTTAAKLTDGDYTITAGDVTCTVKAANEVVTSIKFLSDKAILQDTTNTTAVASYKVYNQFEEDVTDTAKSFIQVTGSEATAPKAGQVLFTKASGKYNLTDVVAAVVIYRKDTNVVTQTATFKISNQSVVAELTVVDTAYNVDKKALTEDTDLVKNPFYILFSAKDQYGNNMTSLTNEATGASIIINFAGGITNLDKVVEKPAVKTLKVNGTEYFAVQLKKAKDKNEKGEDLSLSAGNATLILVSTGTGATVTANTTVTAGTKIDTISLQFNDLIVGGESTEVAYTALDANGKAVTSFEKLAELDQISATEIKDDTARGLWVKEDVATGVAKLYYKSASTPTSDSMDVITLLTKTYKSVSYTVNIKKDAVATAITGTKDLTTGKIAGQEFSLKKANVVIVDQYGRKDKVALANYKLTATAVDNKAFEAGSSLATLNNTVLGNEDTDVIKGKATAGTTTVNFKLYPNNDAETKYVSEYSVTFTGAAQTSIKSYAVADLGTIYSGSATKEAYAKKLEVTGLLSDGTKIALPDTEYNVVTTSHINYTTGKAIVAIDKLADKDGALASVDTINEKVTVVINKTGDEFVKDVVVSKAAPKATSIKIVNDATYVTLTGEVSLINVFEQLIIKDQYGVELKASTTPSVAAQYADTRLTITDTADDVTVNDNGTKDATTTNFTGKATVKLTFADGTVYTVKVSKQ